MKSVAIPMDAKIGRYFSTPAGVTSVGSFGPQGPASKFEGAKFVLPFAPRARGIKTCESEAPGRLIFSFLSITRIHTNLSIFDFLFHKPHADHHARWVDCFAWPGRSSLNQCIGSGKER